MILLKRFRLGLILILLTYVSASSAQSYSWESKYWFVNRHNDEIRFYTSGRTIFPQKIGFIKKISNCNKNYFWAFYKTNDPELKLDKNVSVKMDVRVKSQRFTVPIESTSLAIQIPDFNMLSAMSRSALPNKLDKKLIRAFKKGNHAIITIIPPKSLRNKLELSQDTFSLKGFTAVHKRALQYCRRLKKSL